MSFQTKSEQPRRLRKNPLDRWFCVPPFREVCLSMITILHNKIDTARHAFKERKMSQVCDIFRGKPSLKETVQNVRATKSYVQLIRYVPDEIMIKNQEQ